ncbi:hypothetical protein [Leptolyngbya sp. PCC 6406]|uniref:hypothetical protein n=1 Tax=Leptolyngbya sp. PCC 6406 TaxID=1173264 RepID=UPI0002ABBBAE|nr:hypothetical protein [Leptolyngbya sp. PCC 6406]
MPKPLGSVRIAPELYQQIETCAAEEGCDRAKVTIPALEHSLSPSNDSSPQTKRLKARIAKLEAALQAH